MQDTAGCLGAVMVKVLACDAFAIGALRVREVGIASSLWRRGVCVVDLRVA